MAKSEIMRDAGLASAVAPIAGFVANLKTYIAEYRNRSALRAELDGVPDHILRDVGLTGSDVGALDQLHPAQSAAGEMDKVRRLRSANW